MYNKFFCLIIFFCVQYISNIFILFRTVFYFKFNYIREMGYMIICVDYKKSLNLLGEEFIKK